MRSAFETHLQTREQFFIDKITASLTESSGKILQPLEKSRMDIIHAYVKELTTIQRIRYEYLSYKCGEI